MMLGGATCTASRAIPSGSVSSVKETPWKELEKADKAVLPSMGTGTLGPWQKMVAAARLVPPAAPVTHTCKDSAVHCQIQVDGPTASGLCKAQNVSCTDMSALYAQEVAKQRLCAVATGQKRQVGCLRAVSRYVLA